MNEITIKSSKTKIVLLMLASIVFVLVCIWLLVYPYATNILTGTLVYPVAILGIIFFGFCGLYALSKIFDNTPGLIINDKGITDNSSAVSVGFVDWKDITNVSVTDVFGQKFVTVEVSNSNDLISKQGFLKRFLLNVNMQGYKSPVQLSSVTLKATTEDIFNGISKGLTEFRAKNQR